MNESTPSKRKSTSPEAPEPGLLDIAPSVTLFVDNTSPTEAVSKSAAPAPSEIPAAQASEPDVGSVEVDKELQDAFWSEVVRRTEEAISIKEKPAPRTNP